MNWGGVIAGALGGVGGAVADMGRNEMEQQRKQEMLRMQAEIEKDKLAYADELAKNRALWEVDTSPEGFATKKTGAETAREKAIQGVRTDAAVDQETRLAPIRQTNAVNQAKAVKTAELDVERADTLAKGGDKTYLKAVAALADAKESSATRAAAAKTVYEMNRQKYVDNLRDVASGLLAAGDKAGAEEQLRVADMASGKAQAKNFTDVAAFAKVLEAQAAALLDPMKGGNPEDPKNIAEATAIRQRIQEMAADVSNRRGVGGTEPPPKATGPKEGDRDKSKSGKPIVFRNGQWVYE